MNPEQARIRRSHVRRQKAEDAKKAAVKAQNVVYWDYPLPPKCSHGPPYRLMVVYDVSFSTDHGEIGWAYWRRAKAIQKYAPEHWSVDIFQYSAVPWEACGAYDLVFNLEYAGVNRHRVKGHRPNENVPLIVSYNSDGNRRQEYWKPALGQADFLIVNNQHAFDYFGRQPRTCCISNGVDTEVFRSTVPIEDRTHKAITVGSTGFRKQKGWPEVFWPLESIAAEHGFATDFRPVDEISERFVMPTDRTVEWMNTASYVLCASVSEGTPNFIGEAVSCGAVAVTLPIGNVCEWGRDRENCVIVTTRSPDAFLAGLNYARDHRERLSAAGMKTIREGWSYGAPAHRAAMYFRLFERILTEGVEAIEPFSFLEGPC